MWVKVHICGERWWGVAFSWVPLFSEITQEMIISEQILRWLFSSPHLYAKK